MNEMSNMLISGRKGTGRGTSKHRGPEEIETCLECRRNSKESDITRTEGWGSDGK